MQTQLYNARSISRILGASLVEGENPETPVYHLLTDSRKIVSAKDDLFFALTTQRNDGHNYVNELIDKGLINFVVKEIRDESWLTSKANFILVDDTLLALQYLAAWHRRQFNIPVIGITGSNGKTIVKEWLWQLMADNFNVVRSPKSFNSQIGVPLSVWQMSETRDIGIFEAGISIPGEMEKLEPIIRPTLGIFTNLGPAHNANFMGMHQKATEKLQLFKNCNELICCADHQVIIDAYSQLAWAKKPRLIKWSRAQENAHLHVLTCNKRDGATRIVGRYNYNQLEINVPFTDEASIENVITCWLTLLHLGLKHEEIAERVSQLHPVAMRMEMKEGINNCTLIDDSYSSDFFSLGIALDFLNQQTQHPQKTLILSDMQQSGLSEERLYDSIGRLVFSKHPDRFIGIGPAISRQKTHFAPQSVFFNTTEEFLRNMHMLRFENESILVKGARIFGFERIIHAMQQKKHETVLEINLDALVHNLNYYRRLVNPGVKLMAMVKAFSYGSGSFEIASVLQYHRVDYLAVAYADEGVELRKAGIKLPIMIMNPEEEGYEDIFSYGLEPEVYNFRTLQLLEQALERYQQAMTLPVKIHVKVDTGMKRLGFDALDLPLLAEKLRKNKLFIVCSLFSHLAASDDAEHDVFTNQQISLFGTICNRFKELLGYGFMCHILNSAGISRFSTAQYDMVRLGIGLYGLSNQEGELPLLQHVSTLKSIISQIRHIAAGVSVGYNREFIADRDMQVAVVPVGYADGLSRRLSNGHYSLLVNNQLAPIVGLISMDMCMIDITGIAANEGDEVIIFSTSHPITNLAKAMETIPYEVLTSISRRVRRVYFQD
ncbi:MAG: bifunctional UDP-N-acetylmuramoyl-tripeptide:D-alanyl-D-alanine ligase/alanine racemase [Bacteroidales bacterium]|nr:bifunctional UDP-N-acetylmuramoyl-tripeptide:D-alanyl-D-alanine ligase/alanine racemase [Bacteroidales bacterium]MDZ4203532.1 bifunctional UDP-N-acetylmuramoyl-tripeptide:D-alanyl-D-alanine ligase/alanine racemase [Bacteroidales bacterium]